MAKLLPFRFKYLGNTLLLVNEVGSFLYLDPLLFTDLITDPTLINEELKFEMLGKGFLYEEEYFEQVTDELAIKLRTKKEFLSNFTSLHIVVLTQNCNSNCSYCHASSHSASIDKSLNMDIKTASKVCETII